MEEEHVEARHGPDVVEQIERQCDKRQHQALRITIEQAKGAQQTDDNLSANAALARHEASQQRSRGERVWSLRAKK